jgi:ankyrin repeat protein
LQGNPLCAAVDTDNHIVVRLLLDAGADRNLRGSAGLSAEDLALHRGKLKSRKVFLEP